MSTRTLRGCHTWRKLFVSGKLAGQIAPGRKVSSKAALEAQVIDTIDFNFEQLWKDKHFLHQKYVLEGRSIAQIAVEILSSREAVRMGLIEFGIKRKQRGERGQNPSQAPYGFRKVEGNLIVHLGEHRVIDSIKKMSTSGLSYRTICEFLTSIKVPTKNRGKSWQPEMIRRILNRQISMGSAQKKWS